MSYADQSAVTHHTFPHEVFRIIGPFLSWDSRLIVRRGIQVLPLEACLMLDNGPQTWRINIAFTEDTVIDPKSDI